MVNLNKWMASLYVRGRLLLVCFASIALVATAYADVTANQAVLQSQTRETDYTLGSVARQHLTIDVPKGYVLDEGSLPEKGVTEAIELRDVRWQTEDIGNITRYRFVIDWQIFVAFETVKSTPLRSLELVFNHHNASKHMTVRVPPDSVLVSNLLPPKMDEKHVQPYPDVSPFAINTQPYWLSLFVGLVLLVLSGAYIAWFMGWIRLPSERNMPFRQAWRQMKALSPSQASSTQEAMRLLGQACSQYAGQTVTVENLAGVVNKQQALQPYQDALFGFYQDVQATFYAGQLPKSSLASLVKLSKQLSRLEVA